MTDLMLKTDLGKYEIILRDIEKGYAVIDMIDMPDEKSVLEAISYAKKYNPKKIYIMSKKELSFNLYDKLMSYSLKYSLSKSYKEIKIHQVELSNRQDLLPIINKNIKNGFVIKSIDMADVMEYIRNKEAFYISYKHENVGAIIKKDNEILYFMLDSKIRGSEVASMCLSRMLYFFSTDLTVNLLDMDKSSIELFKSQGFECTGLYKYIYEV